MNEEQEEHAEQSDRREILWAPWRIDYILSEKNEECFLCESCNSEPENWKQHFLVDRTEFSGIVLNKFPYNNGHLLVSPLRHIPDITDLSEEEKMDLMNQLDRFCSLLRETMNPDGFNIGMNLGREAGAGLPDHLHYHIVPRWGGDTNFMPVTGETKVIPQALDALYDMLREEISER